MSNILMHIPFLHDYPVKEILYLSRRLGGKKSICNLCYDIQFVILSYTYRHGNYYTILFIFFFSYKDLILKFYVFGK